jgi:hypothetical protein
MARRSPDGESRLSFVAAIADPEAPTAAELNAGIPLQDHLLEWNFPETDNDMDVSDMGSSFNKNDLGTYGGDSGTLTAYRDDDPDNDLAWATLKRGTRGFMVERLFGGSDVDFADGDVVSVFPGVCGTPAPQPRTRNTPLQIVAGWKMTGEPRHDVVVVAATPTPPGD